MRFDDALRADPGDRFDMVRTNPLARKDLDEFVACYHPANRHERKATWSETKNPTGRWRAYDVEELLARDKASLDVFWLKDEALEAFEGLEGALKGTGG